MPNKSRSYHIATGVYKKFSVHSKLQDDVPAGCVFAVMYADTKIIEHVTLGSLTAARNKALRKACDHVIQVLATTPRLPQDELPLPIAGTKIKNGSRFAIAGMTRDLGDLFLGVYLFRASLLTKAEANKFWHETNNKYIVGDTILLD